MNYVLINVERGWLSSAQLALACCTYAPLNHEMQSNLRSSNGKYCLRHPPATSTPPPLVLFTLKRGGGKATQSSCQCASVCQLELTASHRSVQLNFEFSVLDFSNCTDRGQRQWKLWQRQQWHKASRVNEKDTHVNFNFCSLFRFLCLGRGVCHKGCSN